MEMENVVEFPQTEADEVVALGRMISFVCQRAKEMKLDMSTYLLEMALTSLVHDMGDRKAMAEISGGRPMASVANDFH